VGRTAPVLQTEARRRGPLTYPCDRRCAQGRLPSCDCGDAGHKADVCVLGLGPDLKRLRRPATELQTGGLDVADSYVSLTECPSTPPGAREMKQARLYPDAPPDGKPAMCFYPMSKRRAPGAENWYALSFEDRMELMRGHGAAGREFRGRVLQLVTGSAGLDDWEWGNAFRSAPRRPQGVRLRHAL